MGLTAFDICGNRKDLQSKLRSKQTTEDQDGEFQPMPYVLGMQLPCGLDTQIPQEKIIRGNKERLGNGFTQAG